jgi:hypothetical protein
MKNHHRCKVEGCPHPGIVDLSTGDRVDGKPSTEAGWVCALHFQEGIRLSEMQTELDEHLKNGGLLS